MKLFRKKYIVIYIIKEHGTYSVLKKKRIKPTKNTVKYGRNKTYIIDTTKPTYVKGFKLFYFIEIKKGFLDFEDNKKLPKNKKGKPEIADIKQLSVNIMSPEIVDMIMSQNVVKQIVSGLEGGLGINWMSLITGLALGSFIGLIAGLFF